MVGYEDEAAMIETDVFYVRESGVKILTSHTVASAPGSA